jgi:AmmeMemoRadiSam system protein B
MRLIIVLFIVNLSLIPIFCIAKSSFQPQALIVPHHNLVATYRHQIIKEIARRRLHTDTLIILSPDHFNPSQHVLTTTSANWKLTNGIVAYDSLVGRKFDDLLIQNEMAVKNDHGIYNLLSDLHSVFPQAKIIPILIGSNLKANDLDQLSVRINQSCLTNCLLIASVDFSHYLPANLAEVHDAFSIKQLSTLNDRQIMHTEVDSPQSLYLALQFAKAHEAHRFVLKSHTNSGRLINNYDLETTSHVMAWYQAGQPSPINSETFVYAAHLDRNKSRLTLGDRFFYGADITDPQRNSLDDHRVLAGIKHNGQWRVFEFPLSGAGDSRIFARQPTE